MNNNRAGYSFAILGLASLAAGVACLGWAHLLGGYGFIGATTAIFLAMLSFTKFAALRRSLVDARSIPMPEPMYESVRAPISSMASIKPSWRDREDEEDAELEARLAALRVAALQQSRERHIAPPEPVSEPAVVVVEGPALEPELATLFSASPLEPVATKDKETQTPSSGLRQMDELRAELARLRESARMRQASAPVSVAPPDFLATPSQPSAPAAATPRTQFAQRDTRDAFPSTEFSGLPGESRAEPSEQGEAFPRTEFSGLHTPPPTEGSSFTKTQYLVPNELRR
jgi:hypothetical protein